LKKTLTKKEGNWQEKKRRLKPGGEKKSGDPTMGGRDEEGENRDTTTGKIREPNRGGRSWEGT